MAKKVKCLYPGKRHPRNKAQANMTLKKRIEDAVKLVGIQAARGVGSLSQQKSVLKKIMELDRLISKKSGQ